MYRFVIVQLGFPVWHFESTSEHDIKYVFKVAEAMEIAEFYLQIYHDNNFIKTYKIKRNDL